jgi:hypothetical protein
MPLPARGIVPEVVAGIPLLADVALLRVGVTRGPQCPSTGFEEPVVRLGFTNHQVLRAVIGLVPVYMMDFDSFGQIAAERLLRDQDVFANPTVILALRVVGG